MNEFARATNLDWQAGRAALAQSMHARSTVGNHSGVRAGLTPSVAPGTVMMHADSSEPMERLVEGFLSR
jgi:hypothetical protein